MAISRSIDWMYRDPDYWPSTARASAQLHSLEALARLREHLALTVAGAASNPLPFLGTANLSTNRPRGAG